MFKEQHIIPSVFIDSIGQMVQTLCKFCQKIPYPQVLASPLPTKTKDFIFLSKLCE